jgi:hypothetical protein
VSKKGPVLREDSVAILQEYGAVIAFVRRKGEEGALAPADVDRLLALGGTTYQGYGKHERGERAELDLPAVRHTTRQIHHGLRTLHPEWADEIRNLTSSRGR